MRIYLQKAGSNPDQALSAFIEGPELEKLDIKIGEKVRVEGQPDDVVWKVMRIQHV